MARKNKDIEQEKFLEATRLIGRYYKYILSSDFCRDTMMNAHAKTMMVNILKGKKSERTIKMDVLGEKREVLEMEAETRLEHYANVMYIALRLARGIFDKDEDLSEGIAFCAGLHDYGQDPFGHNGEKAISDAAGAFGAGHRGHNIMGAMQILFDEREKIIEALSRGIRDDVIRNHAIDMLPENERNEYLQLKSKISQRQILMQRIIDDERANGTPDKKIVSVLNEKFDREMVREDNKRMKVLIDKVNANMSTINEGLKYNRFEKIRMQIEEETEKHEEAMETAGNHNGERGMERAKPNPDQNFDRFMVNAENARLDKVFDNDMKVYSMVDLIISYSDWIESVITDVISGKEGGLVEEIPEEYAKPFALINSISEEEAFERLTGTKEEAKRFILQTKHKVIKNVIENSKDGEVIVGLARFLIGIETGIRDITYEQYLTKTTSKNAETALEETMKKTIERLYSSLVSGEKEVFSKKLNDLFKLPKDSFIRKKLEKEILDGIQDPEIKRFYEYVLTTTPEKYAEEKKMAKMLIQYGYEQDLEESIKRIQLTNEKGEIIGIALKSYEDRETKEWIIDTFFIHNRRAIKEFKHLQENNGDFESLMEAIKVYCEYRKYGNSEQFIDHKWDRRIAVSLACYYIERMNEYSYIELGRRLGTINEDEYKELTTLYETGNITNHESKQQLETKKLYADGAASTSNGENRNNETSRE